MHIKLEEKLTVYYVSDLVQKANWLLKESFSWVKVIGEISNLSFPRSGHVYFSLKDDKSQIRCALFSRNYQKSKITLKEGMEVEVFGSIGIYEARGDFQLVIDQVKLSGEGKLKLAFEALKLKLEQEGLFLPKYKKTPPKIPNCIGIITSSTGAALQDVLATLKRRFPCIPVIIYPSLVQGEEASEEIINAISHANKQAKCDVLLLCRGGGSIEDLWAFNKENVARAIFDSQLPIITGIGHEVDYTIADFVSDFRAPTPSGAAELVTPNIKDFSKNLEDQKKRLIHEIFSKLQQLSLNLEYTQKRLQHPQAKIETQYKILAQIQSQLEKMITYQLTIERQKLEGAKQSLHTVSPLNTLKRGYAIALKDKIPLTDARKVKIGELLNLKLAYGEVNCLVEGTKE
jgi:exodeoxyribonuclease VII large subunit